MDTLLAVFVLQSKIEWTYGSNRCRLILTYTWADVCKLRYFINILSGYIECDHSSLSILPAKQLWIQWWKSPKALPICKKNMIFKFMATSSYLWGLHNIHPTLKVFFAWLQNLKSLLCWTFRLSWKSSKYSKKASTIIFLVACKDIWNASKCQSGAAAPFEICKKGL